MDSLTKNILQKMSPTHPDIDKARREATSCRVLLDVKRNGTVKARCVKQGFKENKLVADGPDFNYYSHVAKFDSIRSIVLRPNRRNRKLAVKDISTAFLQSDRYEGGMVKYVSVKSPITGEIEYYEQHGPIYGEASAPVRWERTLIPFLQSQGFVRGDNEKSVLYNKERDIVLLVYVDDVLADGEQQHIEWIFDLLDKRFECKPAEYLTPETPLDYVGIEIEEVDGRIYMHMAKYIQNCITALDLEPRNGGSIKSESRPIIKNIETTQGRLGGLDHTYFLKALGMAGWLANTVRADIAYAFSRIGQHAAKPTVEAKEAITRVFRYLASTPRLGLSVRLYSDRHVRYHYAAQAPESPPWRFYTDSDYAGNDEAQNKRRSQNANVITVEGTPIHWCSKVSSTAFAHPDIGEAHADMSSGAAEVYAAGNAAQDLLHFSYCIDEMGLTQATKFPKPMKLEMDNTTAEVFCKDTAFKTRLKHIDVRQEWVKKLRDKDIIVPVHVHTKENMADLFTKILPLDAFQYLRDEMMTPVPME